MTDLIAHSRAFVEHWNRRDIDAIVAALSEDVVYRNVPLPALHGRDAVRNFITPNLERVTRMHWVVHALAVTADGRKVLTERTDSFYFGTEAVHVPVMGVFEFREALIADWRDYADIGEFVRQMAAIGQRPGWEGPPPGR